MIYYYCLFLIMASGITRGRGETGLSVVKGGIADGSIVLVSCLDGRLIALDRATGREQWTCSSVGGALLSGTAETSEDSDEDRPDYLIEPLFPGHLYLFPSANLIRVILNLTVD